MAAQIDTTADGTVRFAGRNRRRWWGVGNQITDPYDVDKSLREAYLTFRYETRANDLLLLSDVDQVDGAGITHSTRVYDTRPSRFNRSIIKVEGGQPEMELGHCGTRWQPHQPGQMLEFFQQVSQRVAGDLQINTAGSLRNGGMIFAAAMFDRKVKILDCEMVDMYLSFLTSIYGATITGVTGIQIECANTAEYFINQDTPRVTYSHGKALDVRAAVEAIGVVDLDAIERLLNRCAVIPFDANQRAGYFENALIGDRAKPERTIERRRTDMKLERVINPAYKKWDRESTQLREAYSDGPGQDLPSRRDTLLGAWSAVTDFCDHRRRSTDAGRGAQALIGSGPDSIRSIKRRALAAVYQLAA